MEKELKNDYEECYLVGCDRSVNIPTEEYRDIRAMQCGFDDYEDMLAHGMHFAD